MRWVGKVAYKVDFSIKLASVHLVFHVSMMNMFVGDATSIISVVDLEVKENLYYEEVLVEVLD